MDEKQKAWWDDLPPRHLDEREQTHAILSNMNAIWLVIAGLILYLFLR